LLCKVATPLIDALYKVVVPVPVTFKSELFILTVSLKLDIPSTLIVLLTYISSTVNAPPFKDDIDTLLLNVTL
jgi:hypothetical protein